MLIRPWAWYGHGTLLFCQQLQPHLAGRQGRATYTLGGPPSHEVGKQLRLPCDENPSLSRASSRDLAREKPLGVPLSVA